MQQPQHVIVYNSQIAYQVGQAGLNFVVGFLAAVVVVFIGSLIAKQLRVKPSFVPHLAVVSFLVAFFAVEHLK